MRLALFFCQGENRRETWQKSGKVEGRCKTPASSVGDDARIVPRYITYLLASSAAHPRLRADGMALQTLCNVCSDKQGFSTAG